MSLAQFQSEAFGSLGFARSNRFEVRIYLPRGISQVAATMASQSLLGGLKGNKIGRIFSGINAGSIANAGLGAVRNSISTGTSLSSSVTGVGLVNMLGANKMVSLYTNSVNLPNRDNKEITATTYGETRQVGYGHENLPLQIDFYSSEDLFERQLFELWQSIVFNPVNKRSGYYADYTARVDVLKFDYSTPFDKFTESNATAKYTFNEAYVSNVGEMNFSNENGEVARQPITMRYRNFTRVF